MENKSDQLEATTINIINIGTCEGNICDKTYRQLSCSSNLWTEPPACDRSMIYFHLILWREPALCDDGGGQVLWCRCLHHCLKAARCQRRLFVHTNVTFLGDNILRRLFVHTNFSGRQYFSCKFGHPEISMFAQCNPDQHWKSEPWNILVWSKLKSCQSPAPRQVVRVGGLCWIHGRLHCCSIFLDLLHLQFIVIVDKVHQIN